MPGTKPFALGVILLIAPHAPAQRLPLPPNEQQAVNHAVDRGVSYLKRTQQKKGTWANPFNNWKQARFHDHVYAVGFTALPGLTLLECGVPADDPIVQQAARFVRSQAGSLDRTYELSLAILFLDRLGEPKDKKLIQTFALRLIAGQAATGGWGYRCPLLSDKLQTELLMALRHLDPPAGDMPALARGNGKKKPGELPPIARLGGEPMLEGTIARTGGTSLSESIHRNSPGDSPSLRETITDSGERGRDGLESAIKGKKNPEEADTKSDAPAGPKPPENKTDAKPGKDNPADAKAGQGKPSKPFVIPQRIKRLPVVQEPEGQVLQDRASDVVVTSSELTDNSNTQFAILALWTAQRYDVPMKRSLNRVVRRYQTSQNGNGGWNYRYFFGGAAQHEGFSSPGAMTCVGLIGLAVGHGLAQPNRAGPPVQDPRIINGLIALTNFIGQPVEQGGILPMQNLYFLWSLERVAVLYNLPTIGDKDWYRWGAQVLIGNQAIDGNWANGMYHGSSPPLDTCLALLFLKRANLVKDLTDKLPFKAADLNSSIMEKLAPSKATEVTKEPKKTIPPVEPSKAAEPEEPAAMAQAPPPRMESPPEVESSSGKLKWVLVSLMVFILFAGGSLFFLFSIRRREEGEAEDEKPKKRTGKRKPRPGE